MERFGLKRFFPISVNGMQANRPKPFLDIYVEAARRLGREPKECIVFEDSPTGETVGRAAGMRVVGVETTPTEFEGIELKIKDFSDPALEPWLSKQLRA